MLDRVVIPEDRFSCDKAQMLTSFENNITGALSLAFFNFLYSSEVLILSRLFVISFTVSIPSSDKKISLLKIIDLIIG